MEKQQLQVAVLFRKYLESEELEAFLPDRILIGVIDENDFKFYDALSQQTFYNLDCYSDSDDYCGFYYSMPLTDFMNKSDSIDMVQALSDYLSEIKKNAYFYCIETGLTKDFCLKSMPLDLFKEKYGIELSYQYSSDKIDEVDFVKLAEFNKEFDEMQTHIDNNEFDSPTLPSIDKVYNIVRRKVLCQDKQIQNILTAIYKLKLLKESELKANILIYGPSGVGKSAIIKEIAEQLNIPFYIEDATSFTVTGYVGQSAEDSLRHLYLAANGDIDAAEQGILVFDEIDKKNNKGSGDIGVSTDGFLNSMLRLVQGGKFEFEMNHHEKVQFDTSRLTIIISGAFEKLFESINNKKFIGFGDTVDISNDNIDIENIEIVKKFINYGIPKQFIARFNSFVELNSLSKEDLKNILLNAENSMLKVYTRSLKKLGVDLKVEEGVVDRICDLAYSRDTGARALDYIVTELLEDMLYETFKNIGKQKEYILTEEHFNKVHTKEKKFVKTLV